MSHSERDNEEQARYLAEWVLKKEEKKNKRKEKIKSILKFFYGILKMKGR